ncbi:MAG: hypothetical protein KDK36_07015, partial [Leptospiraceae bacterium]|nr:hypothetical protein [Leptospiraceae bacterium]
YKKYVEFHFKKRNYNLAIYMANLALKFRTEDRDLMKMVYKSILRTTPESTHIPIMNKLLVFPEFKEMILKRLYPILIAAGDFNEANYRIEELLTIYKNSETKEAIRNIEVLRVEKVKLYIKDKKLVEAESIIKTELAKVPESPIWNKLNQDLKYIKETTYRPYYYYATNSPEEKEESGEKK